MNALVTWVNAGNCIFFITVNRPAFSNKQKQISFLSLVILQRMGAQNLHVNGLYSDYSVLRVVFPPLTTWLSSMNFICFPSPYSAVVSLCEITN